MKKRLFSLLALLMVAVTGAWADIIPTYNLSVGENDHGTVKFYVGENEVTTAKEGATVTVVITPNTGWVVNQPAGQWIAAEAAARSAVPMLNGFELTKLLGQDNTWSFTMERANAEVSVTYKKLLTNQDITIEDITALTYTGVAQEPTVTVKDGTDVLVKDVDYNVAYSNNTNAALSTATENAPTVTITAVSTSEKYAGETTKTFTINKKAMEDGFIANIDALVYTGVAQTPEPAVTYNNMTLVKGTDFTYSYTNNVNVAAATAENAPTVTVTGKGNYTGTAQKKFDITTAALTVTAVNKQVTFGDDAPQYTVSYDGFVNNETAAVLGGTLAFACSYVKNQTAAGTYDITPSGLTSSNYDITFTKGTLTVGKKALEDGFIANIASLVYNGVAQEPAPVVTFNGMTLEKDVDYSVSYENNVNVGTATATVTALANSTKYSGSASKTFSITTAALTVTADNKQVTYGDAAPQYTVSYTGFVNNETAAVLGGTLAFACDYVKDQSGVGNYTITPSGLTSSNYAITFTNGTLTVGAKTLENGFIATISSLVYNGQAQEPAPVVTFHEMTLAAGTDYTVAYSNNTNAGTATVTCTGQGNYSGQAQKTFTIDQKEATLQWSNTDLVWTGSALKPTCEVTNLCGSDKCDVTVDGAQVDAGTYTATATALSNGNYKLPQAVTAEYQIIKKLDDDTKDAVEGNVKAEVYDETTKQAVITEMTPTEGETTYTIPATIGGYDVVAVTGNLNKAKGITDIYLPAAVVQVNDANLQTASGLARVHAPIQSLGSYAAMLPDHVGEYKVMSEVKQTAQRYWTFSCDVDVLLPEGLEINYIKARSASEVTKVVVNADKIPANNGVMLIGEQGVTYTFVALETTSTGGDYSGNLLEPVLTDTHYAYASGYYVLKNGQFHAIANDAAQIPACKAVLHLSGAAGARVLNIVDSDATGVESVELRTENGEFATAAWYDLNGRKLQGMPTKKGVYIMNGRKVVVR